MTRAVALWLLQSLLGAGLMLGWFAASRRAKALGASRASRWLFPWASLWSAGRFGLLGFEAAALVGYAACVWLARGA
ncbi:MAG: hypothetical protein U0325_07490 [Polyangiales bacterium]